MSRVQWGKPDLTAEMEKLQEQHEALAKKNGRMEFALTLAHWAHDHREELAPHLRTELANLILKAGE